MTKKGAEFNAIFDKVIASAIETADRIDKHDLELRVGAWTMIAAATHKQEHLNKAHELSHGVFGDVRAKHLMIVARSFAKAADFGKARETAREISMIRGCAFWCAETLAHIGQVTGHADDFRKAKAVADHITDPARKKQVLSDIEAFERGVQLPVSGPTNQEGHIVELMTILIRLNGFDATLAVAMQCTSVELRLRALSVIADAIAEAMRN